MLPTPTSRMSIAVIVVDHEPEVLAEEAGDERQRQEDRRDYRELLHDIVLTVADGRQVQVGGAREQIAVGSIRSLIRIRWS